MVTLLSYLVNKIDLIQISVTGRKCLNRFMPIKSAVTGIYHNTSKKLDKVKSSPTHSPQTKSSKIPI
jgi:hypothetical protein